MSHTPSPWIVSPILTEVDRGVPGYVVTSGDRRPPLVVARVRISDAHLIAAAPDLLAACEAALAWPLSGDPQGDCEQAEIIIRAAIKKARGE